jgi:DNA-binding CsgD family transcriptional regulator
MEKYSEIIKQRSVPGVIIFDSEGKLRYANQDSRDLLPALCRGEREGDKQGVGLPSDLAEFVYKMVSEPIPNDPFDEPFIRSAVISSGWGIPLSLRGFLLTPHQKRDGNHQYMVLVEIVVENREIDFFQLKKRVAITDREIEILRMVCAGCSNQEIAAKLYISNYTVKDHIRHLKTKFNVSSRNLLVATVKNR